jgi:hypothetical protein
MSWHCSFSRPKLIYNPTLTCYLFHKKFHFLIESGILNTTELHIKSREIPLKIHIRIAAEFYGNSDEIKLVN